MKKTHFFFQHLETIMNMNSGLELFNYAAENVVFD